MTSMRILIIILLLTLALSGCYEGRGFVYEHLNSQDPGALRTEDPARPRVSADNVSIGGNYDHLREQGCQDQPECCGEFSEEQQAYKALQEQAIAEQNPELCQEIPGRFTVDCFGRAPYDYYNQGVCVREARR